MATMALLVGATSTEGSSKGASTCACFLFSAALTAFFTGRKTMERVLLACLASATPLARRDGQVFALVLTLHPISRLLLEAIRVDEPPALGTPLSISQLVSLVLLAAAAALWWWTFQQPPRGPVGPALRFTPDSLTIRCREDGPLVVEMPTGERFETLSLRVTDHHGNEFPLPVGKRAVALCRCGHTQARPFCDGSHKSCGFRAADVVRG